MQTANRHFHKGLATYQLRMIKMSPADGNPGRRPLHPWPAGSFQAKANPRQRWRPAPVLCISLLSSEQTVTADFILDPPPTCQNTAMASKPPALSPPRRKKKKRTSCHTSWVLINQDHSFIILASIRVHCLLHQLSPPVSIAHACTHKPTQSVSIHA